MQAYFKASALFDIIYPSLNQNTRQQVQAGKRPHLGSNLRALPNSLLLLQHQPDTDARAFYEEAAVGATAVGACIDLYVLSPFKCSLNALQPLAGNTGGIMYLYPELEAASLPQVSSIL